MKQYWLVLHSDVFLWVKNEEGLLYNTKNYKVLHFYNSNLLKEIVGKLLQIDNLYGSSDISSDAAIM